MVTGSDFLPLYDIPSRTWEDARDALVNGDGGWLAKKTDRERRLNEHFSYLVNYAGEALHRPAGLVIDIGPGCGETLEIARYYGHAHLGIDAETGDGGMGDRYLRYCRLMHERQQLNVEYCGLFGFLKNCMDGKRHTFADTVLINMRGSIEQCLHEYMLGAPHHEHQDANQLTWNIGGELRDQFVHMLQMYYRILRPGGVVLIHANGTGDDKNMVEYSHMIRDVAQECGLRLTYSREP